MIISEQNSWVHSDYIKSFSVEKGKFFISTLDEEHSSKYVVFKASKSDLNLYVCIGDDKLIERDSFKIEPPVEEDFKLYLDRKRSKAYY